MLSNQEMKTLGRVARVSLDEEETALLCRDLNALLEMSAVLESLPREDSGMKKTATLGDLRRDVVVPTTDFDDAGKHFSVPPVMEKT